MNRKDTILNALDLAFEKSAEFLKDKRYNQMKEVYLGLREDMMHLDANSLTEEMYERAIDIKGYMQLFWEITDTELANKVYHIKIKALGHSETLTYGKRDLLPAVMHVLNSYLESLTDEEVINNEGNLDNTQYLTEKVHGLLHNEKRDDNPL